MRTLVAPAAGFTITNPAGIAGDPTFALADDLAAIEAIGGTGYLVRTAASTWAVRTFVASLNRITLTNQAGIAGGTQIDIDSAYAGQASITTLGTVGTGIWNAGNVTAPTVTATVSVITPQVTTNAASALELRTSGGVQLKIQHVVGAVDFWQAEGNAAGVPAFRAVGASANISPQFVSKGTGSLDFLTAGTGPIRFFTNGGALQFVVTHIAGSVDYWQVEGSSAGVPRIVATGTSANISPQFVSKGTGNLDFLTANTGSVRFFTAGGTIQCIILHNAGATRYLTITGSNGGNPAIAATAGYIGLNGAGVVITAPDNASYQVLISGTTKGMRFITGAAGAYMEAVDNTGVASYQPMLLNGISVQFLTSGVEQVRVSHTAAAVNSWSFTGGVTGARVSVSALGTDTNIGIQFGTKGTGDYAFFCGSTAQVQILATASATRYLVFTGSNGGNPSINVSGGILAITPGFTSLANSDVDARFTAKVYVEKGIVTPGFAAGVVTIDWSAGNTFVLSVTAAITGWTMTNIPATGIPEDIRIILVSDGTSRAVNNPAAWSWGDGTAITTTHATNLKENHILLTTRDNGTKLQAANGGVGY